jgi:caffeoyl-CoA O-methyltransferase
MREDAHLAALREETASHPMARMQISPEQGQLMSVLIKLLGAKKTLEIGVFTGYSAMVVAKAMGPGGRVVGMDVSEEFTRVARQHWAKAGVADRIDLRIAPALETLKKLIAGGESGTFDFAFVDADKAGYRGYYERCLELLRPGGLAIFDNMLWEGKVADPRARDRDTQAIRELNAFASRDPRVASSLVQVGDGVLLAMKLP